MAINKEAVITTTEKGHYTSWIERKTCFEKHINVCHFSQENGMHLLYSKTENKKINITRSTSDSTIPYISLHPPKEKKLL